MTTRAILSAVRAAPEPRAACLAASRSLPPSRSPTLPTRLWPVRRWHRQVAQLLQQQRDGELASAQVQAMASAAVAGKDGDMAEAGRKHMKALK